MNSASTGEPPIGVPPPFTRSDLDAARRMVRRRGAGDEAEDVAQEVAIAAARCSQPIVVPGHTAADARRFVMAGIARRQVARHRAERARRGARSGEPVRARDRDEAAQILERLHGTAPSAEERILERGRITLLRAAIDELRREAPELYPVMAAELAGVSIPRVAAELGIPLGTAYTRSRRGREAVRAQVRRWEDDTPGAVRMWIDAMRRGRGR